MGLLTEITITKDDVAEFEQTATIGLQLDEHEEYQRRLKWLCEERLKERILAKISEVVEGAKLTEDEIDFAYHYSEYTTWDLYKALDKLIQAQLQAIIKSIKED